MKKLFLTGIATLLLATGAAHAREWQGNMPKPIGKLPSYPPIVCVTPNWTPELCESRKSPPVDAFEDFARRLADLFKWLRWTETNWLGTVLVDYKPLVDYKWNGVWPNTTVLQHEPGGIISEHIKRWQELAQSGNDVEIRGSCFSACTLIIGYIPKERLCFGDHASLQFHAARELNGKLSEWATWRMFNDYPNDIRNWLNARGGVPKMTIANFWKLRAKELWDMGYHKCKSSTVQWTGPGNAIIVP